MFDIRMFGISMSLYTSTKQYATVELCLTDTPAAETRSCYSLISAQVHVRTSFSTAFRVYFGFSF